MKRIMMMTLCAGGVLWAGEVQTPPADKQLALVKEYKEMFDKISRQRVGVPEREIESLAEPFVPPKKRSKKVETPKKGAGAKVVTPSYALQAIMNDRAKISGRWYHVGDDVHGMKLISIKDGVVWLKNSSFRKRLTLRKENAKISIK